MFKSLCSKSLQRIKNGTQSANESKSEVDEESTRDGAREVHHLALAPHIDHVVPVPMAHEPHLVPGVQPVEDVGDAAVVRGPLHVVDPVVVGDGVGAGAAGLRAFPG